MADYKRGAHAAPSSRMPLSRQERTDQYEFDWDEEEPLSIPSRSSHREKSGFTPPGFSSPQKKRMNIEAVPRVSRKEIEDAMSRTSEPTPSPRPSAGRGGAHAARSAQNRPVEESPHAPLNEEPPRQQPAPSAQEDKAALRAKRRQRRLRDLRNLLLRTVFLLLVVYVLFFHVVGIMIMPNGDMSPRLETGDLVLYFRLNLDVHSGDVVVLEKYVEPETAASFGGAVAAAAAGAKRATAMDQIVAGVNAFDRAVKALLRRPIPTQPGETYVCRVNAAPGDTVDITDGERVLVNGNALIESNIFYTTPEYLGFVEYPLTLGPDEYFVLADHRQGGADSRFFGPVKENDILGVVITVARRNNL